jgi:hypothetical protein
MLYKQSVPPASRHSSHTRASSLIYSDWSGFSSSRSVTPAGQLVDPNLGSIVHTVERITKRSPQRC